MPSRRAVLGAVRFVFELNRSSEMVAGSPFLSALVSINFLHFAILIFGISAGILVVVSLATQPESLAKLRGLTFATLGGDYTPPARDRRVFTLQVAASVALVLLVTSLWILFA